MISPKTWAGAREAGWVGKDQQRCDFQKSLAGSEEDWSVNYTAEVILLKGKGTGLQVLAVGRNRPMAEREGVCGLSL